MVWTTLNGRRGANSATSDRMTGYGPVALHVAGTGEVRFRDVAIKDLNRGHSAVRCNRDVAVPDITRSCNMKRHRSITCHPVAGRRIGPAASVECRPDHVGIHDHVEVIPLGRPNLGRRRAACTRGPRRGGRGRLRRFFLLFRQRACGAGETRYLSVPVYPGASGHSRELRSRSEQARAAQLFSLRVQRQIIRTAVSGERHVDALPPAFWSLHRSQQDAGIAIPVAAELRVNLTSW